MSVVSPTPGLMDHLSCCSSPTMARTPSIKTEHLALIGFAARLGSSMTSDALEATKTREDAQLLMNLLHPESLLRSKDTHDVADTADGTNDGSKEARRSHPNGASGLKGNEFAFSFACPSLSIDADRDRTGEATLTQQTELSEQTDGERARDGTPSPPQQPRPSQLFQRAVSVNDRDGVKDAVESVARNVMQSFSVALEWRCRAWIDSLTKVHFLKEGLMAQQYRDAYAEELEGQEEQEYEEEEDEGDDDEEEEEGYEEESDEISVNEECDDASEEGMYEEQSEVLYSKEMTVVDTLARMISEVSVRDVQTTFRVLPQVAGKDTQGATPSRVMGSSAPPPKKRKIRQVTLEHDVEPTEGQCSSPNKKQYDIAHGILFEAAMTVSIGAEEQQVILTAPGSIVGTFFNTAGGEGEEVLTGVTVKLDTDALALSMERNSRFLIRKAAEADLSPAPLQTTCEEYTSDVPEMSKTAYADVYPQAAVITPKHGGSPPSSFSSGGSDRDITEDLTIPPPVPCLNASNNDDNAHPKTISPTLMSTPTHMSSPTLTSESDSWCLFTPKETLAKSVLPSLVSPSPTHHQGHEEEVPRAEESEWYSFRGEQAKHDGPSLPALVEVACAAMCAAT